MKWVRFKIAIFKYITAGKTYPVTQEDADDYWIVNDNGYGESLGKILFKMVDEQDEALVVELIEESDDD